jgi:hypothetical protein
VKKHDWIKYALVDSQGEPLSPPERFDYRVGGAVQPSHWCQALEDALPEFRVGEARAVLLAEGASLRLLISRHIPRFSFDSGAYLDVTSVSCNMKQPVLGSVLFYTEGDRRERWRVTTEAPEKMQALSRLKVHEEGVFHADSVDPGCTLRLLHMSCYEDISVLQDGSLWKLSLELPEGGGHEKPRLGKRVQAYVDNEADEWTWGLGSRNDMQELAARSCGCGERAEFSAEKDGKVMLALHITHIGNDPAFSSSDETPEEYSCAVAKDLYAKRRLLLAYSHWHHAHLTLEPTYDEEGAAKQLGARMMAGHWNLNRVESNRMPYAPY